MSTPTPRSSTDHAAAIDRHDSLKETDNSVGDSYELHIPGSLNVFVFSYRFLLYNREHQGYDRCD